MKYCFLFSLFFYFSFAINRYDPPKMIHLALTGNSDEMVISWTTALNTLSQAVIWKSGDIDKTTFIGSSNTYLESAGWTHHVKVSGLIHNTKYSYECGNPLTGWSEELSFTTGPLEGDRSNYTFIMYGDMGVIEYSYYTVKYVTQAIEEQNWDVAFIHHAGDFGYGDVRAPMYYETSWNLVFTQMASPMQKVPYMIAPGNHEESCGSIECDFYANNFTVYNHRFKMPYEESNAPSNMWYSFNYGNIHWIAISTETDYPNCPYEDDTFGNQIAWLTQDLENANNNENIDWIIATGHQPIYSSISSKSNIFGDPIGPSMYVQQAFESLFYQYNVDLYIDGHVHGYERTYPVYQNNIPGTYSFDNYTNPEATVYVINGNAGNIEGFYDDWNSNAPAWSAIRYWPNPKHGFGVLETFGSNSLTWKMYPEGSDPFKDEYYDKFSITRTSTSKRKIRKYKD